MLRRIWHAIRFFAAAHVRTRDELEAALKRSPPFIIVEGTESLRAYAASLAYHGGQEAAALEQAALQQAGPAYIMVPTVGRIRDGYRQRAGPKRPGSERPPAGGQRTERLSLHAGVGTVVAAGAALAALLGAEWLLWPSGTSELVRRTRPPMLPLRRDEMAPLPTHASAASVLNLHEQLVDLLVPLLVLAAICALAFLVWQAIGPGRPARLSWRVAYRVPGQLVIARVRTRTA